MNTLVTKNDIRKTTDRLIKQIDKISCKLTLKIGGIAIIGMIMLTVLMKLFNL